MVAATAFASWWIIWVREQITNILLAKGTFPVILAEKHPAIRGANE
jgi:hypothetical protein